MRTSHRQDGRARRASAVWPVWTTLAALALAGCAALPVAVVPPTQDRPVVTPAQAQRIASATGDVVSRVGAVGAAGAAGAAWDADLAATRLTGPAAQWAAFAVPAGRPPPVGMLPGPVEQGVLIAPRAADWPRAFAVVDDAPAVMRVYVSESARSPYRLWAAMPVVDPAAVPAFGPPDAGVASVLPGPSPQASPQSEGAGTATEGAGTATEGAVAATAERSMADVVGDLAARYVDVLSAGDASLHAPEFEADGFAAAVRDRVEAERNRLAGVAQTDVSHEVAGPAGAPAVVLSALAANGDALVVAAFTTTVTSTVIPGSGAITVSDDLAGPAGTSAVDGTLITQSVAALAFVVPATTGNIQVVAAADSVTGVTVTP